MNSYVRIGLDGDIRIHRYWDLTFRAGSGNGNGTGAGGFTEVVDQLQNALRQTFRRASGLLGDRPLGVLLSGGVDSSILAGVAKEELPRVIGYTAQIQGFENPELDRARAVAKALGIEHRIIRVS